LSYTEALWYLEYLLSDPVLRPTALVVQVNYQAFWTTGIRPSLLELLNDAAFRSRIERHVHREGAYVDDFRSALKQFDDQRPPESTHESTTLAHGFGYRLEDAARARLDRIPLFERRADGKEAFEEMLYRLRLYLLHIRPSTARSISGPRLSRNRAALETLAEECRTARVPLVLFSAPVNPRVPLYASAADRRGFEQIVAGVESRYGRRVLRFDDLVPAEWWGRQFNGPDPLHMGRRAHALVASNMITALTTALSPVN
jgi:hypothetical protein